MRTLPKRTFAFLFCLFIATTQAEAQCLAWHLTGAADFSDSVADARCGIAVDHSSNVYAGFSDYQQGNRLTVMRYNGSAWSTVGPAGFPTWLPLDVHAGGTEYVTNYSISMATGANDTPYIAFLSSAYFYSGAEGFVMKFNGTGWDTVGSPMTAPPGGIDQFHFRMGANNTPYVTFLSPSAYGTTHALIVEKFDGAHWVVVGGTSPSTGQTDFSDFAFDSHGAPYVVYDDIPLHKATVKKFDGTSWTTIGTVGFSSIEPVNTTIAIGKNDTPYIAYTDGTGAIFSVMKYNGIAWINVGSSTLTTGSSSPTSAVIGIDTVTNRPYVCMNINVSSATVREFDGTSWVEAGTGQFPISGGTYLAGYDPMALSTTGKPFVVYTHFLSSGAMKLNVMERDSVTVGSITGSSSLCVGSTATLTDTTSGGTWSSSATGIATIGSGGVISGVTTGTVTITYSTFSGCSTTTTETVNTTPGAPAAISGTGSLCQGATTLLSDATTGGAWSSSSTAIATVSGGTVSGISAGTAIISYMISNSCGSVAATTTVTVTPPPATPGPITGTPTVCAGATSTLSDGTAGGAWSSSATAIATVSGGTVGGVSAGTAIISYMISNSCGSVAATTTVTVNPLPTTPAAITGTPTVCTGATTTLSDGTAGGAWSSSATSIATIGSGGIVSGFSPGIVLISYTISNSCGSAAATASVTVNTVPVAPGPITGTPTVCTGATSTLSDGTAGGAWSSSATAIATVSGGTVGGVSAGTAIISYLMSNSCGTTAATATVTVNPLPAAPAAISGVSLVCIGTTIGLSDGTAGGEWSSSATGIATVGSSGLVSGVSAGTALVSYTMSNSCGSAEVTETVTVNTAPAPPASITGVSIVLTGATTTLNDATAGGTWSSSATGIATVSGSGLVSGISAGTAIISYTVLNSCGGASASDTITVDLPTLVQAISGSGEVLIYPDPVKDWLSIETRGLGYTSYMITNEAGQLVRQSRITAEKTTVDLAALPIGQYLITLRGEKGTQTEKVIKIQ